MLLLVCPYLKDVILLQTHNFTRWHVQLSQGSSDQMLCVDFAQVDDARATCLFVNQSRPQSLLKARALSTTASKPPARTPSSDAFSMPVQDLKKFSECTVDFLLSAFRAHAQNANSIHEIALASSMYARDRLILLCSYGNKARL